MAQREQNKKPVAASLAFGKGCTTVLLGVKVRSMWLRKNGGPTLLSFFMMLTRHLVDLALRSSRKLLAKCMALVGSISGLILNSNPFPAVTMPLIWSGDA